MFCPFTASINKKRKAHLRPSYVLQVGGNGGADLNPPDQSAGLGAGIAGEMVDVDGYIEGVTLPSLRCPECGKIFYGRNRRQLVERHRIIHTGERPYQCPLCFKRMNVKHHLTRHLRTVHLNQWDYLKKLNLV